MATIIHQRYIEQHTCVSPESAKVCRECHIERDRERRASMRVEYAANGIDLTALHAAIFGEADVR